MALVKEVNVRYEISVVTETAIKEDGTTISSERNRRVILETDDISGEDPKIQNAAADLWPA